MAYYGTQRDPTAVIGRRILAFIIDGILMWAIIIAVGAALAKSYTNAPTDACSILRGQGISAPTCFQTGSHVYVLNGGQTGTLWLLGIGVWLLNYTILQGATGASVGKFMLGLRVVNAEGQVCGMGRAFVRSLLLIVDEFFCFLVGLITVNVTHPHQRVGDLVAKTYVVAASDVGIQIAAPVAATAATWGQPAAPAWGQPQQPAWPPAQQTAPPVWGQPATAPPPYGEPAAQPAWGAPPPPPRQAGMRRRLPRPRLRLRPRRRGMRRRPRLPTRPRPPNSRRPLRHPRRRARGRPGGTAPCKKTTTTPRSSTAFRCRSVLLRV